MLHSRAKILHSVVKPVDLNDLKYYSDFVKVLDIMESITRSGSAHTRNLNTLAWIPFSPATGLHEKRGRYIDEIKSTLCLPQMDGRSHYLFTY